MNAETLIKQITDLFSYKLIINPKNIEIVVRQETDAFFCAYPIDVTDGSTFRKAFGAVKATDLEALQQLLENIKGFI